MPPVRQLRDVQPVEQSVTTYFKTVLSSPVGDLLLTGDGKNLTGLWITGQTPDETANGAVENDALPVFLKTKDWLDRYFAGQRTTPDELPLKPKGNAFRQRVWAILREIPYGETTTYGAIARRIESETGGRMSAQAVGGAVGHNPVSIVIPCHRVLGANGRLTGYAGGLHLKTALLKIEKADVRFV